MPPISGADAATAALLARAIPFTFVFNVRDLGGLTTADGRTVQPGRLYRADGVNRLSGDDLDAARNLGLRTVIDLRTKGEVERGRFPVDEIHVTWHHLPMIRRMWSEDDLVANDGDAAAFLRDRYLDMLDEGADSIRQIVELVADGVPALFHCAAGKDRTGVVAAILLSLVGVAPDEVAQDYHLSAHTMAAFMDWLQEHHPDAVDAMSKQPKEYMAAPAEAMEGFLAEVDARYGSMHGLAEHLEIPGTTITRLTKSLLD